MKLVSVNTGLPRQVSWHGRIVTTAIFKEPVAGRVALRKLNLDGDRQADLSVHGGEHKAVYCYPLAHYDYWKKELPGRELSMGMFGENFTIDDGGKGSLEESIHLGDRFSVGTAEVAVTQPRLPCYKLGIRFGSDDIVKRFPREWHSSTGWGSSPCRRSLPPSTKRSLSNSSRSIWASNLCRFW
jgi:MOSC domain-containing protein YiiM